MKTVWLLLQNLAAGWKNKKHIAFIIVLIIIMIGTICYVRKKGSIEAEPVKIVLGVAKEDTSEYADLLLQYFNENEVFLHYVELVEEEEESLKTMLKQGALDAYLVIPKDFAQSMIKMENLPIRAVVSTDNPTKALVLRHVTEAYENYIEAVEVNCTALYRRMKEEGFSSAEVNAANVDISLDLIFTALGKDDFFRQRVVETEEKETLSYAEHYLYTGIYFILLFLFLPAGLRVIAMQREGLLSRLKSVNMNAGSVLAAVGIPYLLGAALLLFAVCCMNGIKERFLPALVWIIPWLAVFLVLGLACGDNKRYLFICSMVIVCLAVLGGGLIPEEFLPDSFQKIAAWMPNRTFTHVMGGVQP